jgi:prepilin-type N-terminal cleavage/methylation domain-containing protein
MKRVRSNGFTLVEILITVVVAGVLGAALMGLVLGQQRFYGHSDDTIIAQQNIRAAMDLMATELRMASPTDVMVARSDSVVVRSDILRAVVCGVTGGDEATVFVYDSVTSANLPPAFRGTAYSGAYDSTFVYGDGFTPSNSIGGPAIGTCTGNGSPTGQPNWTYRRTSGWTGQFGAVPDRGSLLRWYGALNGTVLNSVTGPNMANIRQVRVVVAATGGGVNRFGVRRPITYDIPLRN